MTPDHLPSRRRFLGAAGLAGLGLGALPAPAAAPARRIRSCILLFSYGGPSHLDTLDPKPDAPAEVRGPFRPTATRVPGIQLIPGPSERAASRPASARDAHRAVAVPARGPPLTIPGTTPDNVVNMGESCGGGP